MSLLLSIQYPIHQTKKTKASSQLNNDDRPAKHSDITIEYRID